MKYRNNREVRTGDVVLHFGTGLHVGRALADGSIRAENGLPLIAEDCLCLDDVRHAVATDPQCLPPIPWPTNAEVDSIVDPQYTTELPTVPGAYWWRLNAIGKVLAVWVAVIDGDLTATWTGETPPVHRRQLVSQMGGEWSGPIPF